MSLAAGSRLGAYEILDRLGAGAMGEVFRARDPRLGRDVAIKVLPLEFAGNVERRRRFEQESRAAGGLNHPNLVAVYDVGEQDGHSYIVSELVEGETLRDLLRKTPVPVRKVIDIGAQIADGLAAAHTAGVVHRDLKPDNVMLTRDGRAKILDFGLARQQTAAHALPEGRTMTMTDPGMIMGTPGYMSPEQVAGTLADARTDIFSFGSVLYEMLAGKLAFERPTTIETMRAILREDPPDLPGTVPPGLQSIVMHCLEKEPSRRYQSAQDLAFALRALSGSAIGSAAGLPVVKPRPKLLPAAAAALALLAIYGLAGMILAPRGFDLAKYRFTPVASGSTRQGNASWSPDGKSIAYVRSNPGALDSLMVRSLDTMLPVTVARADLRTTPFWSPDGARLFFVGPDGIFSVSRAGGPQQQILKGYFATAALSPDGRSLVYWLDRDERNVPVPKLWISSPPGAAPRKYEPVIWQSLGHSDPIYLRFSPDGRQLAVSFTGVGGAEVWLLPFPDGNAARGKPHRVFEPSLPSFAPSISWMPDSRHLVLAFAPPDKMSQFWMGDTKTGALAPFTSGESDLEKAEVSPDGNHIAYAGVMADADLVQIPFEGGMLRPLLSTSRNEWAAAWSPASPQFAYVTTRNGRPEIWAQSAEEGWERPVVTQHDFPEPTVDFSGLAFSPDGERLAYTRSTNRELAVIWISPAAGGQPLQLTKDDEYGFGPTWSPDGNWIVYQSSERGLMKVPAGGGQAATIYKGECTYAARWSPDGRWIACPEWDHIALLSAEGKLQRNLGNRLAMVAWSRDSKVLFTLGRDQSQKWLLTSIDLQTGAEKTITTMGAEQSFRGDISNNSMISLSPDGKSVTATSTTIKSDVWVLEGFPQPKGPLARLLWWR
jgi:eukaryotic-like serine/threonine-protein kinase